MAVHDDVLDDVLAFDRGSSIFTEIHQKTVAYLVFGV
jgi:hypothetical protein